MSKVDTERFQDKDGSEQTRTNGQTEDDVGVNLQHSSGENTIYGNQKTTRRNLIMGFNTKIETQVSTVFPNPIVDYLDYVCDDMEMSRSQFIRKSVKENLKEYQEHKERKVQLNV